MLSKSKVLQSFHAFAFTSLAWFSMTMIMYWSSMTIISLKIIDWSLDTIAELLKSIIINATLLVARVVVFLRRIKINIIFNSTFFSSFVYFCQLSFSTWNIFRFWKCSNIIGLKLCIRTEKIMNSHWWNLHLLFINRRRYLNQNSILKYPTNNLSPNKICLTLTILNSSFPISFIKRSVSPKHLSITFTLIWDKVTFIKISTWKI